MILLSKVETTIYSTKMGRMDVKITRYSTGGVVVERRTRELPEWISVGVNGDTTTDDSELYAQAIREIL